MRGREMSVLLRGILELGGMHLFVRCTLRHIYQKGNEGKALNASDLLLIIFFSKLSDSRIT